MHDLSIYSVTDLEASPQKLIRSEENLKYYCHIPFPLPEQIVLFAVGDWGFFTNKTVIEAVLVLNDEPVTLGKLTPSASSLCWSGKWDASLIKKCKESRQELAKILLTVDGEVRQKKKTSIEAYFTKASDDKLVEPIENTVITETPSTKAELESTPQIVMDKTPDVPKIKKQKHSSKKLEKTPDGPTPKKQKGSGTRMRVLSAEFKTPGKRQRLDRGKENADKKIKNDVLKDCKLNRISLCKDVSSRGDCPTVRWGHSMCVVHDNRAVVIGGQGDKQQLSKDSVWTLDPETRKWKEPDTLGEASKPEYRMGHTATYDPMVRCIYVYGGSKNLKWFKDVHILDVDEWKWQLVKVSGKAPTRAYHSATLYRHELWIFGGVYPRPDPQPDGCSNDICIFSPMMEGWYNPVVLGEKPIARSGHSASIIKDRLVMFGGWDAPYVYNDLHILDLSIVEWIQPKLNGTPPSPRSWHASSVLSRNRVLIHGGYDGNLALDDAHIFNLDSMTWVQIKLNDAPSARAGHMALGLPYYHENQEEDEILVFGGGDNDGAFYNDLFSISIPFQPATITTDAQTQLLPMPVNS